MISASSLPTFRHHLLLLLAMMVLTGLPLRAQLTLDECHRLAEQHYPLVRQTDLIRQTEALTLANLQKGWLPQITASAQATLQSDVAQWPDALTQMLRATGQTIPQGMARDQYKLALNLDQRLYDGGHIRAQKAVAQADAHVQQQETAVQLYALRQRVDDLFFGILLVDEQLDNNTLLQTLLADNVRQLTAAVQAGTAVESHVITLQAERVKAEQTALSLRVQRHSLQRLLAAFIGRSESEVQRLECPKPAAVSRLEIHRPELALFDARAALLDRRDQLLHTALRPSVSAFAQGWYGYPGLNLFDDMYRRRWSVNALVGVRAMWNLSAFYTYRNDRARLAAARRQNEVAREVFRFNQTLQATQEDEEILRLRTLLRSDDTLIDLCRKVREATAARLLHGTADAHALLQDLTREDQARVARSAHHLQLLQALYRLRNTLNHE